MIFIQRFDAVSFWCLRNMFLDFRSAQSRLNSLKFVAGKDHKNWKWRFIRRLARLRAHVRRRRGISERINETKFLTHKFLYIFCSKPCDTYPPWLRHECPGSAGELRVLSHRSGRYLQDSSFKRNSQKLKIFRDACLSTLLSPLELN